MAQAPLSVAEFAAKIKAKYPQYSDVDDYTLTTKMLEKYPEYRGQVDLKKNGSAPLGGGESGGVTPSTLPTEPPAAPIFERFPTEQQPQGAPTIEQAARPTGERAIFERFPTGQPQTTPTVEEVAPGRPLTEATTPRLSFPLLKEFMGVIYPEGEERRRQMEEDVRAAKRSEDVIPYISRTAERAKQDIKSEIRNLEEQINYISGNFVTLPDGSRIPPTWIPNAEQQLSQLNAQWSKLKNLELVTQENTSGVYYSTNTGNFVDYKSPEEFLTVIKSTLGLSDRADEVLTREEIAAIYDEANTYIPLNQFKKIAPVEALNMGVKVDPTDFARAERGAGIKVEQGDFESYINDMFRSVGTVFSESLVGGTERFAERIGDEALRAVGVPESIAGKPGEIAGYGRELTKVISQLFPQDPEKQERFYNQFTTSMGSLGGFIILNQLSAGVLGTGAGAAGLTGAARYSATARILANAKMIAPAVYTAAVGDAAAQFDRTLNETGDIDKATLSWLTGFASGTVQVLPMIGIYGRLNAVTGGRFTKSMLPNMLLEGGKSGADITVQDIAGKVLRNLSDKEIYDFSREIITSGEIRESLIAGLAAVFTGFRVPGNLQTADQEALVREMYDNLRTIRNEQIGDFTLGGILAQPTEGEMTGIRIEVPVEEQAQPPVMGEQAVPVIDAEQQARQEVETYTAGLFSEMRTQETLDPVLATMQNAESLDDAQADNAIQTIFNEIDRINQDPDLSQETKTALTNQLYDIAEQIDNYEFRATTETVTVAQADATQRPSKASYPTSTERYFDGQTATVNGQSVSLTVNERGQVVSQAVTPESQIPALEQRKRDLQAKIDGEVKKEKGETVAKLRQEQAQVQQQIDQLQAAPVAEQAAPIVLDIPTMGAPTIEFNEDGSFASITYTDRDGNTLTMDGDAGLDLAIKTRMQEVGEVPEQVFQQAVTEAEQEITVRREYIRERQTQPSEAQQEQAVLEGVRDGRTEEEGGQEGTQLRTQEEEVTPSMGQQAREEVTQPVPSEVEAAKQRLRDAYQVWIAPSFAATRESIAAKDRQLIDALRDLAKAYIAEGVKTVEEFIQKAGDALQGIGRDLIDQGWGKGAAPTREISTNATPIVSELKNTPLANEDGATMNLDGTRYTGGGLVVPAASLNTTISEITPEMVADFVEQNRGKISNESFKVGLYKFENSDLTSIDLNIVVPKQNLDVALAFAKAAGQESLFDLDTMESIKTGADGLNPRSFSDTEFREIANALSSNRMPNVFGEQTNIDPNAVRSLSRAGSKVGMGLISKQVKGQPVVEEAPEMSIEYAKQANPQFFIKIANQLAQYPLVQGVMKLRKVGMDKDKPMYIDYKNVNQKNIDKAQEVINVFKEQVKGNLQVLMDNAPEDFKELMTLWYDGANKIANTLAGQYNYTAEQVAGVMASLSPQKDWYQNVKLAELVIQGMVENPVLTDAMMDKMIEIRDIGYAAAQKKKTPAQLNKLSNETDRIITALRSNVGKPLDQIPNEWKPYVIRLDAEVNKSKDYNILLPDGSVAEIATKKDGTPAQWAFGSFTEIGKAVNILLDGSQQNISTQLGNAHKIRNFYNNIIDPMSEDGDITMDTHAIAAALFLPLSGNSIEVGHNLSGISSDPIGLVGNYFVYADAYRELAAETGYLPRQIQSITWEVVRGLFTKEFKASKNNVDSIRGIFDEFAKGKITIDEARRQTIERAGGFGEPTWGGSVSEESRSRSREESQRRRSDGAGRDVVGRGERGRLTQPLSVQEATQKLRAAYQVWIAPSFAATRESIAAKDKQFIDALVNLAKAYIAEGVKTAKEFAAKTGLSIRDARVIMRAAETGESLDVKTDDLQRISNRWKSTVDYEESLTVGEKVKQGFEEYLSSKQAEAKQKLTDLKQQMQTRVDAAKDKAKATATAIKSRRQAMFDLIQKDLKDVPMDGLRKSEFNRILNNLKNAVSDRQIDKAIDTAYGLFSDAGKRRVYNILGKLRDRANTNIGKGKLGVVKPDSPFRQIVNISPEIVPGEVINVYRSILEEIGARQAVLPVKNRQILEEDINFVLSAIQENIEYATVLRDAYNDYAGKGTYAENLRAMLEDGVITPEQFEFMKSNKNMILDKPTVEREIDEVALEEERQVYIELLKDAVIPKQVDGVDTDSNAIVRFFNSITEADLDALTLPELKQLANIYDNFNAGFVPHLANLMRNTVDANRRAEKVADVTKNYKGDLLSFSAKLSAALRGTTFELQKFRKNPVAYIDQAVNNFQNNNIYRNLFQKMGSQYSALQNDSNTIAVTLNKAINKLSKNPRTQQQQTALISFYNIQKEFEDNPGNPEVAPVSAWLEATIKDSESIYDENSKAMLQELFDKYAIDGEFDLQKAWAGFTPAMREAYETLVNLSETMIRPKAEHTASMKRGQPIRMRDSYAHIPLVRTGRDVNMENWMNGFYRPSTKSHALTPRTGKTHATLFDPFWTFNRSARMTLTDYYLTDEVRTVQKTLNNLIKNSDGKQKEVHKDLKSVFNELLESTIAISAGTDSTAEKYMEEVIKKGYQAQLSSLTRATAEATSNYTFALLYRGESIAASFPILRKYGNDVLSAAMQSLGSTQSARLYSAIGSANKNIDFSTADINTIKKVTGFDSKTAAVLKQLNNETVKRLYEGVDVVATFILTKPDQMVARQLWFGEFARRFKALTGQEANFEKFAENDVAYMNKYRDAIADATNQADNTITQAVASSNPFDGIAQNQVKPSKNFIVALGRHFNTYLTRFARYEFNAANRAVHSLWGNGMLSKADATRLLVAVTTRNSVYLLMTQHVTQLAWSAMAAALGFDVEDEEKQFDDRAIQRSIFSTVLQLTVFRNLGNVQKIPLNFIVEAANVKFGENYTYEGEYDPYHDNIAYPLVPLKMEEVMKPGAIVNSSLGITGAYSPLLRALYRGGLAAQRAVTSKREETREKYINELMYRTTTELVGTTFGLPFYKDIRGVMMKIMYNTDKQVKDAVRRNTRQSTTRQSTTRQSTTR